MLKPVDTPVSSVSSESAHSAFGFRSREQYAPGSGSGVSVSVVTPVATAPMNLNQAAFSASSIRHTTATPPILQHVDAAVAKALSQHSHQDSQWDASRAQTPHQAYEEEHKSYQKPSMLPRPPWWRRIKAQAEKVYYHIKNKVLVATSKSVPNQPLKTTPLGYKPSATNVQLPKVHNVVKIVLLMLVVIFYSGSFKRILFPFSAEYTQSMRPSKAINDEEMTAYISQWRPLLEAYALQNNNVFVVCAAYLRQYRQYAIMRTEDGSYVDVINPTWFPVPEQSDLVPTKEVSLLCEDQTDLATISTERHTVIQVNFMGARNDHRNVVLRRLDAVLFQHVMDVMNGQWMCPESNTQPRVPANGHYIYDKNVAAKLFYSNFTREL